MTPIPINETALLHVEKELFDTITTESGFTLALVPEYEFESNVSVTGIVAALSSDSKLNVNVGDKVLFSYSVISHRDFPNTADHFVPVSRETGQISVWMNAKGEKIRKLAHHGAISLIYTATYFDKRGQFLEGCQGTEATVDRWLSQFKFGNAQGFRYKNLIEMGGKKYWRCRDMNVFAKVTDKGVESVGDRVICEIMQIPVDKRILMQMGIHLPDSLVQMVYVDRAKVINGGEDIGLKAGDVISFEEKYRELYDLDGKKYCLIKKNRIQGIYGS